jgi:hypothetical protein
MAVREDPGVPAYERAETRFLLARALEEAGSDPVRARALAAQARAGLGNASHRDADLAREVDAWVRAHP